MMLGKTVRSQLQSMLNLLDRWPEFSTSLNTLKCCERGAKACCRVELPAHAPREKNLCTFGKVKNSSKMGAEEKPNL